MICAFKSLVNVFKCCSNRIPIHSIILPDFRIFVKILHFQIFMKKCLHNFENKMKIIFGFDLHLKAPVVFECWFNYIPWFIQYFFRISGFLSKFCIFRFSWKKCQHNFEKSNEDHFRIWSMHLKALVVVFKCCFNCIPWFIQYLFRISGFSS